MVIAVWGTGVEAAAAVRYFQKSGEQVFCFDEAPRGSKGVRADWDLEVEVVRVNDPAISAADLIIASPGVPRTSAQRRLFIEAGKKITTGTDIFLGRHWRQTVGITGTKGKSTTSMLVEALLRHAGLDTHLGGNIGLPLLELDSTMQSPDSWMIAELSSYQCAFVTRSPRVAVITNLFQDHLPWHGSREQYARDKLRLATEGCQQLVTTEQVLRVIAELHLTVDAEIRTVENDSMTRLDPDGLPEYLRAPHNLENLKLAVLAVESILGHRLQTLAIHEALEATAGLPHRLERFAATGDLTWIDDTLATTPESVMAAVASLPADANLTLILGGLDRGVPYGELDAFLLERHRQVRVVILPDSGARMVEQFAISYPSQVLAAIDLDDAVLVANSHAERPGYVLLSPGAPSQNVYRNFEAKSEAFREAVAQLTTG